jgi:hypothetical protein
MRWEAELPSFTTHTDQLSERIALTLLQHNIGVRYLDAIMGHSQSTPSAHGPSSTPQQSSSAGLHENFTYKPLSHPRSFRILRLTRKVPTDPSRTDWDNIELHGSIVEASLDNVPEYFALSYTWGSSSLDDEIRIDGRVLRITRNCADALRRMLKGKLKRMLWVDSICINQAGMCPCIAYDIYCSLIL